MASSTTSSRSSANHRTFRDDNLESAEIRFLKPNDPTPVEITELGACLLNTDGLDLSIAIGGFISPQPPLGILASCIHPGPEKARYEACLSRAEQGQLALNDQRFDAVKLQWMSVNQILLQVLMQDNAFRQS